MILHLKKMKKMLLLTIRRMAWSDYSRVVLMKVNALSVSFLSVTAPLVVP
jgi:hypothetical protein